MKIYLTGLVHRGVEMLKVIAGAITTVALGTVIPLLLLDLPIYVLSSYCPFTNSFFYLIDKIFDFVFSDHLN